MASLLPPQSSDLFELTLESSIEPRWAELAGGADAIRGVKFNPPASLLPFLVFEYGFGVLTPYLSNLYALVVQREGIDWQRIRGTPAAVAKGLGWISHSGVLEDAWHGRVFWNSTQLRLDTLPTRDVPDLEQIEGIARLSLPLRSHLRRVVHHYDIEPTTGDWSRLDSALLDRESGVAVTQIGTVFSFGRTTEIVHLLTEEEGTSIGNWLPPVTEGGLLWVNMQYPWVTATFRWADNPATQRHALMAAWFSVRVLYLTFKDGGGNKIGHRRCRANQTVREVPTGVYTAGGLKYAPVTGGTRVYIEAMTDFRDAFDVEAKSVELTVGASLATGVPPGRLWLKPDELIGGQPIAVTPVSLPLRKTVREQVKFLLRF